MGVMDADQVQFTDEEQKKINNWYEEVASRRNRLSVKKVKEVGFPLLHCAALVGRIEIVKRLISEGFDPNAREQFLSGNALHYATHEGQIDVIRHLVSMGVDMNAENYFAETPLHCAAYKGEIEIVKFFVSEGANVNAIDSGGMTPLDEAVFSQSHIFDEENRKSWTKIIKYLESIGAKSAQDIIKKERTFFDEQDTADDF